MSPTRDEMRQAVLGQLHAHADVTWTQPGSANAYADSVLELADRMRLAAEAEIPARGPGASRKSIDAARQALVDALKGAGL